MPLHNPHWVRGPDAAMNNPPDALLCSAALLQAQAGQPSPSQRGSANTGGMGRTHPTHASTRTHRPCTAVVRRPSGASARPLSGLHKKHLPSVCLPGVLVACRRRCALSRAHRCGGRSRRRRTQQTGRNDWLRALPWPWSPITTASAATRMEVSTLRGRSASWPTTASDLPRSPRSQLQPLV